MVRKEYLINGLQILNLNFCQRGKYIYVSACILFCVNNNCRPNLEASTETSVNVSLVSLIDYFLYNHILYIGNSTNKST